MFKKIMLDLQKYFWFCWSNFLLRLCQKNKKYISDFLHLKIVGEELVGYTFRVGFTYRADYTVPYRVAAGGDETL
jgi:hypothetical protein